eukprot:357374-Chlamydomonas_euryale.AAC.4
MVNIAVRVRAGHWSVCGARQRREGGGGAEKVLVWPRCDGAGCRCACLALPPPPPLRSLSPSDVCQRSSRLPSVLQCLRLYLPTQPSHASTFRAGSLHGTCHYAYGLTRGLQCRRLCLPTNPRTQAPPPSLHGTCQRAWGLTRGLQCWRLCGHCARLLPLRASPRAAMPSIQPSALDPQPYIPENLKLYP